MKHYFTADTHFGHKNIIKYCHRPFANIDEMDATLINNINRVVEENDMLYHLGDFSLGGSVAFYRKLINCKNVFLVLGNHDKLTFSAYRKAFSGVYTMRDIKPFGQSITLCHYAMRIWNKSHYGAWHLYGHSHGTLPELNSNLSFDVGVDANDYMPLSFHDVKLRMSKKNFVPIDHHKRR